MNGYIDNRRDRLLLTVLCSAAYFFSYMTRVNYKTVLAAVMESENLTKDAASVALTGLFITYGLGQLLSGWLGDRINPKYLMCGGLCLAALMNILMPLCGSVALMTVVWCINGLGQAMMWPPIVKTLTNFLNPDDYLHASVKVSWGSAFATILLYLICPVIIRVSGSWKPVFYICALIGAAGAAIIFAAITGLEKKYPMAGKQEISDIADKAAEAKPSMPKKIYGFFGILLLCIIVQGALRDGVDAWMPSYIKETFDLGSSISILSGVVLPIFTILSYQAATFIYEKFIKNEMTCGAFFYVLAAVFSAGLLLLRQLPSASGAFSISTVLSILLFALIVGCMHAINLLFTCFVPRRFRKYGNISWISGLTNFATYVGSAASTYGFAVLTEDFGWNGTILTWIALGIAGAAVCLWGFFPWRKFLKTEK